MKLGGNKGASGPHNTKQAATPSKSGKSVKVAKPKAPKNSLKGKRAR